MTTPTPTDTTPAPTLVVAEVFGPTIQGEGPSCGRRASFIRLGGCNLSCTWCDQPETWDASRHDLRQQLTRTPVIDIARRAILGAPGLIVITGGEPLLHQHQPGWQKLLNWMHATGVDIEVETNGTIPPTAHTTQHVAQFNVSPKLAHSGDPEHQRIRPEALADLTATHKAVFKFVCRTPADVHHTASLTATHGIPPQRVWIMPEGTTTSALSERLATIADPAITAGFNLTTRLHVHTWGDQKGR